MGAPVLGYAGQAIVAFVAAAGLALGLASGRYRGNPLIWGVLAIAVLAIGITDVLH